LGNPGNDYLFHRHNIGFMAVDFFASYHQFPPFTSKFSGMVTDKQIDGKKFILCKPMTFMNRSGNCVQQLIQFYKIPLESMIVIHDDLDLDPARLKTKQGGSAGGHNGLKDIDRALGQNYWRIRVGIGHPGHKDAVSGYVLNNIPKSDFSLFEGLIYEMAKHMPSLMNDPLPTWIANVVQQ
jgi:PTH1 family peptidyl-tRNA hydrolase